MAATPEATDTEEAGATPDLDVSVRDEAEGKRRLSIRVPAGRVEQVREAERRQLGSSLNLKGFRPGKVPPEVVEQRYGEVVVERTLRTVVQEAYREALVEADLRPVSDPELDEVRHRDDGDVTFEALVEVAPTPELERIGGFRLERPSVEVEEEDVDEVLERLREDEAVWQPVTRAPAEGDQVAVRIVPEDGEEAEGEGAEPYRFELGEGYAIPDVEEAILSLEPGESDDFEVRFPEDFGDDELAGTERRLRIDLLEVKEKDLPPLDDEFATRIGDFEGMEDLRGAVVEDLQRHREEEAEEVVRRSLLDSIIEANPFTVPESMVERYLDRVIDAPDDVDPEELQEARRSFYPRAEQEVKRQLVLDHLMDREGFEATEEEVDARIREIAEQREMDPEDVRTRLRRQQRLDGVRQHIATEKLFEHLKEKSEIR